ncbi:MAG: hypothetical protein HYZ11_12035 [Candidatus Tectomicrobia bacterium]|uniref:Uncharacterized protein n=1 Tax=Tectimicrobiota bacterium TaxID=2528274 RepID=A0A932I217_UNCTE|nr:hypothetical protein [Candidatus Tectomicrobia bacterium]
MFALFWEQFKVLLEAAVPAAAQAALLYLIVRFALAVAGLLLDLAEASSPKPRPASGPAGGPGILPPQQAQIAGQARPGIPERASS